MAEENVIENEVLENPTETTEDIVTPENSTAETEGENEAQGEENEGYGENDGDSDVNGEWSGLDIQYGEGRKHEEEPVPEVNDAEEPVEEEVQMPVRRGALARVEETTVVETVSDAEGTAEESQEEVLETAELIGINDDNGANIVATITTSDYEGGVDIPLMAHMATAAIVLAAVVTMVMANKLLKPHRMQIVKVENPQNNESKTRKAKNSDALKIATTSKCETKSKNQTKTQSKAKTRKIKRASAVRTAGTK